MGTKMKYIAFMVGISCLAIGTDAIFNPRCGAKNTSCGDGSCIPTEEICNGVQNCPRGEDERNCEHKDAANADGAEKINDSSCRSDEFTCNGGQCIPIAWVCDGHSDCRYGGDEDNCDYSTTSRRPWYTTTTPDWRTTTRPWYTTTTPDWRTTTRPWYTTTTPDWYTTPAPIYSSTTAAPPVSCNEPFDRVGDRCVVVEPFLGMTWNEATFFCDKLYASLVVLDSVSFYADLVEFINDKGLTSRHYWVGATDEHHEGLWTWINGANVTMGTPLWALYYDSENNSYEQEPNRYTDVPENCGYLDKDRFYFMDDDNCAVEKAAICQIPTWPTASSSGRSEGHEYPQGRLLEILVGAEKSKEKEVIGVHGTD